MKLIKTLILLAILFPLSLQAQKETQVIKLPDLEEWINDQEGDLYVINFWATWCRPCVAELPFFDEIQKEYEDQGVKVRLVSLDFVEELEKVKKFVAKKNPAPPTYLLDEAKAHIWIDKISEEWSGAIPATLFVNKNKDIYIFHEGDFTLEELSQKVSTLIQE